MSNTTNNTPAADVVPLAKSTRGTNGTTKSGRAVPVKTGDPKKDAAAKPAAAKPAAKTTTTPAKPAAKRAAAKTTTPAKTTTKDAAAKPAVERAQRHTVAVVRERKSRVTGTLVRIIDTLAPKSPVPANADKPWAVVCVDHEHVEHRATRSECRTNASDPSQWCPKCKRAAAKSAK